MRIQVTSTLTAKRQHHVNSGLSPPAHGPKISGADALYFPTWIAKSVSHSRTQAILFGLASHTTNPIRRPPTDTRSPSCELDADIMKTRTVACSSEEACDVPSNRRGLQVGRGVRMLNVRNQTYACLFVLAKLKTDARQRTAAKLWRLGLVVVKSVNRYVMQAKAKTISQRREGRTTTRFRLDCDPLQPTNNPAKATEPQVR